MHKQLVIFFLGVWVALLPLLGFPGSWKTFFFVVSGLAIAVLSFRVLYRQRAALHQDKAQKQSPAPPLSETAPTVNVQ